MDNKPTIYGVMAPRELLADLADYAESGKVPEPWMADKLRALLDVPAAPVEPCAIADALESAQWPNNSIGNKVLVAAAITELRKAAQPQGEPVGYMQKGASAHFLCKEMLDPLNGYTIPVYSEQPAPAPSLIAQSVGVLTFMRDEYEHAGCACCPGGDHVFCRYFKGLPDFNDLTENMRHRNDLEGREFRVTVELVGPLPPVRHS